MKKLKKREKMTINITVYLVLRILVVISLIGQAIRGNWNNVFLCVLTLILFTLPTFISKKFNIELPKTLEIIVYLFIYSAEILGEIQNFYGIFSLIDILNHNPNFHINMSPAFASLVAFTFSMTIGVIWEFAEFSADRYLLKDMQKDTIINRISSVKINPTGENIPIIIDNIDKTVIYSNKNQDVTIIQDGYLELGVNDTMKDLFVNFIGALVFSIFGYLYVKNREGYKFTEKFLMILKSKIE